MTTITDNMAIVESARIKHLFSASKPALITSVLLASILAFTERNVISSYVVAIWYCLLILVSIARASLLILFERHKFEDHSATRKWLMRFRLGVLLSAIVWGSIGYLMFPVSNLQHQMFLIFVLAGISAGGMISFSADLVSAVVYSVTVLVPLIFYLFTDNSSLSFTMGAAGALYLGFIIMSSRQINMNILENTILRIEAVEKEKFERKNADNLELNNRILTQINERVTLSDILKELTLHVEALNPGMICSILLLDNDGKTLRTGAAPSLPSFYNKAIDGVEIGDNVGSCGTAAYRGERVIVEDIEVHPYWAAYRELASKAKLQSCWSQPFKNKDGKVLGTFAIYHHHKTHPTENELSLIADYANLAQLAIETNRAQNDLRISAIAFDSNEGMVVTDANGIILRVNNAFTKITGYAEDDVIGKKLGVHGSSIKELNIYSEMWEAIKGTEVWEGEISNYRKNGETYPELLTIAKVKDTNSIATNYVISIVDITIRKNAEEEIQSLAFYDPLTHLPNRRLLLDRLNLALINSKRSGKDVALLFLDLDHFKTLNDSLGHDIGDILLKQVAERLTSCIRDSDTAARLGGDEYLVMLENLSEQSIEAAAQAEIISEKILLALNQPYQLHKNEYQSTVSIGVALFGNQNISQDELLKHADIAMYQAKKAGRNSVCFYDPQMQHTIHARLELERELREAIEKQQFKLYYQIQVDHLGSPLGAEALIRWHHPERGLVSPFQFIQLAEETGLILPIGEWVLEAACAQLKVWEQSAYSSALTISINVSAKQFRQEGFVNQVQTAVNRYAINPKLLKLELTESILLESIEATIKIMNDLKKTGIRFSLDDFGTGYSSLQYLKRLPLSQLKIDQSFVHDIVSDTNDKAIVRTIIAMAQSMELEVIAEGVETIEQRQLLQNTGCMKFQGYLFGKPVSIEEFDLLLNQKISTSDSVSNY
jgi:diguanylate cyclase (GGDEF)-like protein/PAS domain S-box-containing protein